MRCDDLRLIQQWILQWRGTGTTIEIAPVVPSADTRAVVAPFLEATPRPERTQDLSCRRRVDNVANCVHASASPPALTQRKSACPCCSISPACPSSSARSPPFSAFSTRRRRTPRRESSTRPITCRRSGSRPTCFPWFGRSSSLRPHQEHPRSGSPGRLRRPFADERKDIRRFAGPHSGDARASQDDRRRNGRRGRGPRDRCFFRSAPTARRRCRAPTILLHFALPNFYFHSDHGLRHPSLRRSGDRQARLPRRRARHNHSLKGSLRL